MDISRFSEGTCTNCTDQPQAVTLNNIKDAIAVLDDIGTDQLAEYMKKEGFDPECGGILVWPTARQVDWGVFGPPSYVLFSNIITGPMLMNTELLIFHQGKPIRHRG